MYSSSITKTPAIRYNMEGIKDMIPTLWSPIIIVYDKDDALGISHWGPQRQQFYGTMINKFKEGDFLDLYLNDIEDMMLLIAQNKLFNLDGDVIVDFLTALKMFTQGIIVKNRVEDVQLEPYTPNYDPPGIIYEDKSKKKRLMRLDEIHKFCDGTLQSVSKILRERLLNFKFGSNKYMPVREWTTKDKKRTSIMLNKIDDLLFKRRILRSSEVLVGGRKIEMDKRLLQRTSPTHYPRDLARTIELYLSIHNDDLNPSKANIKQALRRSDTYVGNPVKEVLLNLNLPDHKSVLTEPEGPCNDGDEIPLVPAYLLKSLVFKMKQSKGDNHNSFQIKQGIARQPEACDPYSIVDKPDTGLIYLNNKNENMVMYLVEIVKLCDATLERVLKEVKLKIFETKFWKKASC
ncbi:hypothetical protein Tco_1116557 [Tanacetum coccineum]